MLSVKIGDLVYATSNTAEDRGSHVGVYMGIMVDRRFKGNYIRLLSKGEIILIPAWMWRCEVISESR